MKRRGFLAMLAGAAAGVGAWLASPWKGEAEAPAFEVEEYMARGDYAVYDRLHKGRSTEWDDDGKMMEVNFEEMRSVLEHVPTRTSLGFDRQLDEQEKAFVLEHCTPPAILTAAMRDWKEWEDEVRFTA